MGLKAIVDDIHAQLAIIDPRSRPLSPRRCSAASS
jgi:hypothetical protein